MLKNETDASALNGMFKIVLLEKKPIGTTANGESIAAWRVVSNTADAIVGYIDLIDRPSARNGYRVFVPKFSDSEMKVFLNEDGLEDFQKGVEYSSIEEFVEEMTKTNSLPELGGVIQDLSFKRSGYICTDPDTQQYRKTLSETSYMFSELRINFNGDLYRYKSEIELGDYTEDEINDIAKGYNPGGLDEVKSLYGEEWKSIIAEMIFEQETDEELLFPTQRGDGNNDVYNGLKRI